jgi:SSS family transporter
MLIGFILLYLLITIGIGAWASLRVKTTQDFVVAGRNLPTFVAASALFATWFGSETILGASSEFVSHGLLGVIEDPFGAAMCLILVGIFFARPLYRLSILTINDLFRLRFSRTAEIVSALFMVPSYFGWIAAQLLALAFIIKTVAGIPLIYGILICTLVVVIYTYIGGMWAVSITDTVQTIMIVLGLLVLIGTLLYQSGGLQPVLEATPEGFFRFYPEREPMEWVHYFAAWITIGLGSIPQQDIFQRVMSARNERTAVRASYLSGAMYLTIGLLPMFIALIGQYLYPELSVDDAQQLIPTIVLQHGSLLLQILFFGALISAILSTTSGAILAPATVLGENLIKPFLRKQDDQQTLRIMRLAVIFVAICSALMAASSSSIYELVGTSSALSLVSLFVPLCAGLYWKRASNWGTLLSMGVGMATWIYFDFFAHSEWPSLLPGLGASMLAMMLGSVFFPDDSYQRFEEQKGYLTEGN